MYVKVACVYVNTARLQWVHSARTCAPPVPQHRLCVFIYTYMYVCAYTNTHAYIFTCVYTHCRPAMNAQRTDTRARPGPQHRVCVCTYIYAWKYMHTHEHMYMYLHLYMHTAGLQWTHSARTRAQPVPRHKAHLQLPLLPPSPPPPPTAQAYYIYLCVYTYMMQCSEFTIRIPRLFPKNSLRSCRYGVATISRLLKIRGLFCRILSLL